MPVTFSEPAGVGIGVLWRNYDAEADAHVEYLVHLFVGDVSRHAYEAKNGVRRGQIVEDIADLSRDSVEVQKSITCNVHERLDSELLL